MCQPMFFAVLSEGSWRTVHCPRKAVGVFETYVNSWTLLPGSRVHAAAVANALTEEAHRSTISFIAT